MILLYHHYIALSSESKLYATLYLSRLDNELDLGTVWTKNYYVLPTWTRHSERTLPTRGWGHATAATNAGRLHSAWHFKHCIKNPYLFYPGPVIIIFHYLNLYLIVKACSFISTHHNLLHLLKLRAAEVLSHLPLYR